MQGHRHGCAVDTVLTLTEFVFQERDRDDSNHSNNKTITSKQEECYVSQPREGLIHAGMERVGLSGRASRDRRKQQGSMGRSHGMFKGPGVERTVGCGL